MKIALRVLSFLFFVGIGFSSCGDDTPEVEVLCEFIDGELTIEPFCSFDPRVATEAYFPVGTWVAGAAVGQERYSFSYSTDPDFTGSAISVRYIDLPLIVTVTERSTGCVKSLTLENTYWD